MAADPLSEFDAAVAAASEHLRQVRAGLYRVPGGLRPLPFVSPVVFEIHIAADAACSVEFLTDVHRRMALASAVPARAAAAVARSA